MILLLLSFNIIIINAAQLNVSVYYETLCPASMHFITHQFYPAWTETENYLDVDLVPFGKAIASNTSGHWEFECQHGPLECYGNKIHSCVLANYSTNQSVEFINCAMNFQNPNSQYALQTCSHRNNISWSSLQDCVKSGKADDLLAKNGEKTTSVTPRIMFVPSIAFNNVFNRNMQNTIRAHFLKVVCQLLKNLPDICKNMDIFVNMIDDDTL